MLYSSITLLNVFHNVLILEKWIINLFTDMVNYVASYWRGVGSYYMSIVVVKNV